MPEQPPGETNTRSAVFGLSARASSPFTWVFARGVSVIMVASRDCSRTGDRCTSAREVSPCQMLVQNHGTPRPPSVVSIVDGPGLQAGGRPVPRFQLLAGDLSRGAWTREAGSALEAYGWVPYNPTVAVGITERAHVTGVPAHALRLTSDDRAGESVRPGAPLAGADRRGRAPA